MNYAQLRAFHSVAAAGSFTKAADMLHVTQPTLSAQVKALEETYGVELFERRGRGIAATDLGRHLLEITRRYFNLESEAEELLSATRGLTRGHLRVGADAPYHVMGALAAFNRRYPKLTLSLSIGNSAELLQDLLEHRSDIAILADVPGDPRLHALPLRRDRLIGFVPRQHALARKGRIEAARLAAHRLVLREPGSTTRHLFETAMARAGHDLGEVLEIGSREAVREAVAAGLGIGIVSESEFGEDRRLKPLRLAGIDVAMTEYVVCLAERRELRLVRAFLEIVAAAAR
jgi:LysR family transcriptional regulator, low CO2-responsive transcriptional regulator